MAEKRLEALVGDKLRAKNWTICSAESCTGGLIMHRLTNISGCSAYVLGGVVAYSNTIKHNILHVRQGTLIAHGAVSEQVAAEMANGAKDLFGAHLAVSVTGIAGPDGGTVEKPVGLTYIGLAGPNNMSIVRRYVWEHDREGNKAASADAAFQMILEMMDGLKG